MVDKYLDPFLAAFGCRRLRMSSHADRFLLVCCMLTLITLFTDKEMLSGKANKAIVEK